MKKILSTFAVMLCLGAAMTASAQEVTLEKFTHQNVVGSQTCYADDTAEKDITALPDVIMGMRINNPVIRAYLSSDVQSTVTIRAEQYSKFGKLLRTDEKQINITTDSTAFEFDRVRNAYSVKIYADGEYIGGINDDVKYTNGMTFTQAPSDYQIYQRSDDNNAKITIAGSLENPGSPIEISGNTVTVHFTDEQETASVIVAEYDDNNLLCGISVTEKQADENTVTVTSPSPYSDNTRVMVWDSLDSMKPVQLQNAAASVTVSATNKETAETAVQTVDASNGFNVGLTLNTGLYDIKVTCADGSAEFKSVGVGDIWVAAGQSNMTDMGAVADGFDPYTEDPIYENMHIMYAEDTKWQQMSHPAGEGRFFKTGLRTSPVTSFAREISLTENVPVGIVQSSVGGTNIYQWAKGIKPQDATDGYLIDALKSCFDNMPSTDIKGIIWYQGCNDAITESYAYNYAELENAVFSQLRAFFGENTPIITTQINDANQDSTAALGYYDAWSYVKDVQRRNPELFDNVYVVGTGALDLGDTIHNSAESNLSVGGAWAKTALNRIYGHTDIQYLHPTIDKIDIADEHTLTLTFKDVGPQGLFVRSDTKRLGITNGLYTIKLGDLKQEFTVRQGGTKTPSASNTDKGTTLTITNAVLNNDFADGKQTLTLTVAEEMAGTIAVDCCYGKRFAPSLTDKSSNWSVLSFYNVIADWGDDVPKPQQVQVYSAADTALISEGDITAGEFPGTLSVDLPANTPSDEYMFMNCFSRKNAYPFVKFDLSGLDTSHVQSASLRIFTNEINRDRSGNISIYAAGTDWNSNSSYSDYSAMSQNNELIKTYENVNTSTVFPASHYSDIDISDYITSLENPAQTAFGISCSHAAVALMSGINSPNPPQLVIQPGRITTLAYSCNGSPADNVEVTIYGTGATEYTPQTFTTDDSGRITAVLTDGTYRAVTRAGSYNTSEERFTVTMDSELSFSLTKNEMVPSEIVISGGSSEAFIGTSTPPFTAVLYDTDINVINGALWSWSCDKGASVNDGIVTIPADADEGDTITLTVSASFNGITITKTVQIKAIDIKSYTFGGEYIESKTFDTQNAENIPVGNSGLTVSTSGGNYNGVYVRNSSSPSTGYFPYTRGFKAENDAYYLFAGAGGNNNNTVITLNLAKTIPAGQEITLKMAKPKATNNGSNERSAQNNPLTVVIGSQTIDLQNNYAFDEWKTETFISNTDVSEITLRLGAWCAVAIESISIG